MLDRALSAAIRRPLLAIARQLVAWRVGADAISIGGFVVGLGAAGCIATAQFSAGLAMMLLSRLFDGLDGAVARLTQPTDRGAFLDITLDFLFYASIPLAFAVADAAANALPAAVLLAAFIGTGSTFLAFAVQAEKRGLKSQARPDKGLFYLGGLTEASETLACFVFMALWPQHFAVLAYGFAALCGLTIVGRLHAGWRALGP
ncbi:MAG: CDP-alcohol phosphatidyltransferase family protein [Rubrivivax sp.]|nr:CDP-alcohol phosphatidyltransferase family protein [Rubrivivax sp.]